MNGFQEGNPILAWVDHLPTAWKARRMKEVAKTSLSSVDKKTEAGENAVRLCNYTDVYKNDFITSDLDFMEATASMSEIQRFRLSEDDVIITKDSETPDDIAVPAYIPHDLGGVVCGYHLAVIRPSKDVIVGRFLFRALQASGVREQFYSTANGITRYGIGQDSISNAIVPVPPFVLQHSIASFLDRKIAAIDALIAKKQRLVKLLEEKRQSIITRAVTKGIDPNAKMKDSGVEWLGEIPAHWIVAPTKLVARLESGHTPSRQHPEYWVNCTVPWFSLSDVWQIRSGRQDYLGETKEMISELGIDNSGARLLPAGTVVVSRTASVGFSGIMPCPMATTQDFANWICGTRLQPEYLLYVFRGMKEEFKRLMMGSTHQTIYMPEIETFRTPVPPIVEQKDIVKYVRDRTRLFDEVLDRASSLVERLREYRQALITAAVTGKINVREEKVA